MQTTNNTASIPLVPEQCNVLKHCGDAFCKAVETKFGCTAIFQNLEDSDSFGSNASMLSAPEVRYLKQLSNGVKVSVCKDDLTRVKVDSVVNAANEKLRHAGGLAQALSEAGGPMIQKWSMDVIEKQGKVPTGTAVVTAAGLLPCKSIIHAVGPYLPSNPSQWDVEQSVPILHKTIGSILEIVERDKISSVAIPALSSGLFNFPRDICANIIVNAIKQHNEYNAFKGRPVEINLINNDEPTVKEMERACKDFLGPSIIPSSYSGAAKGTNQSTSFSSGNSLHFGNITLHLKKGYIERQEVDVIVNTIGTFDLNVGEISKAILKKAGKKIQEEIKSNKRSVATSGDIFVTAGHNLDCTEVYHTVCPFSSDPGATKILFSLVLDCLKKTLYSPHKSIAFPAIGTGNLHFCKHDVAQIMVDAVASFAKQNLSKNMDIHFVVFPKDNEMMKAFENKLNSMKEEMKSSALSKDMMQSSAFATKKPTRNETPALEISGVFKEAVDEAKAWTEYILNPQITTKTIMNNHVIYLGQKDHENLMSLQTKFEVKIQEFFRGGNGGITISGEHVCVSCVAIEVESMLCKAQEDFALNEESDLLYYVVRWHCQDLPLSPKTSAALEKAFLARNEVVVLTQCLEDSGKMTHHKIRVNLNNYLLETNGKTSKVERACLFIDYSPFPLASKSFYARTGVKSMPLEMERELKWCGLSIIKIEKIENTALQQLFKLYGMRVKDKPECLYQCVSAQFCDLICRVGFHKDFAPPAEQKYGSGIYFSSTLDGALKLWNGQKEKYIYIIQAKVLTGKSTIGSPDLILPPAMVSKPLKRYDSVNDKRNTHVIFSGQQAVPEYLIVCERKETFRAL